MNAMSTDLVEASATMRVDVVTAAPDPGQFLATIRDVAMNPAVDVAKMNALVDLQVRLMTIAAEQEFNRALVELQGEVPRVSKDGRIVNHKTGEVQSTYARYEDIDTAVRPLMQKHGFAISFDNPELSGGVMRFTAELRHRAGHSKVYSLSLPIDSSGAKNGTQGGGSTTSYAKRYLLCSSLNVVTEGQDTDANPEARITDEQLMTIETILVDRKIDPARILGWLKIKTLAEIPAVRYTALLDGLKRAK